MSLHENLIANSHGKENTVERNVTRLTQLIAVDINSSHEQPFNLNDLSITFVHRGLTHVPSVNLQ